MRRRTRHGGTRLPMGMSAAAVVVMVLGACTSFDPVDRGVCGNGVIEAGEDCDASDPTCVRCAVTCATAMDCPNEAYACGVDGLCHAPGGALGPATPAGPFQVNDVAIIDVDRDGLGDAVGVSSTSIGVRFGDPSGRLTRLESIITPTHAGTPAFGDLDGDGAADISVRTADGIVSYGSAFGTLSPLWAQTTLVDDAGTSDIDIRYLFRGGPFTAGMFFVQGPAIVIAMFDFAFPANSHAEAPCGVRLGAIPATALTAADVDVYTVNASNIVVSMVFDTTPRRVCVVQLYKPLLAPWQITDITPVNAALSRRPVLADLDGDGDPCPHLINNDGGAGMLRAWDGALVAGRCSLPAVASPQGAALPPAGAAIPANTVVGRVPLTPAFGTYASDLVVLSDGLYGYDPGIGFVLLYGSGRRLAGAVHADLDGDGLGDGVLIAESEDDIDVILRRPNAVFPILPGYVVFRVDTASRVVSARIGDFDGNGRADLAFVEQLAGYQRLGISYASSDYLLPPITVGAFAGVLSMATVSLPTTEDQAGVIDDLLVLQPPAPGRTASTITLLAGSTLRTMIPFFDPRNDDDPDGAGPMQSVRAATTLAALVVGNFVAAAGEASATPDLVAIAVDTVQESDSTVPDPSFVFRMPGTPAGPDSSETAGIATVGLDCKASALCPFDASFLAWPVSPTQDVVFAIDRAATPRAVRFDPAATGVVQAEALPAITSVLPGDAVVHDLFSADLDGDGAAELVVMAGPRAAPATGALLVCEMASGAPTSCVDWMPALIASARAQGHEVAACVGAAPAQLSFRDARSVAAPASDLVVACRENGGSLLFRVRQGGALATTEALEITRLARTATRFGGVRIGDVTGDGLDDVLVIEGESGALSLVVFAQCSSRDLEACARGGGGS